MNQSINTWWGNWYNQSWRTYTKRSCRRTLKYSQESQKEIWHHTKSANAEIVVIPQNNAHRCPAFGKNVASVAKRNIYFATMCTALVSYGGDHVTRENFDWKPRQRNLPRLSIKLTSPNQMMSHYYICHVLRSRQWSYQTPGGASAKGRWELWEDSKTMQTDCSLEANWLIMKDYKKH